MKIEASSANPAEPFSQLEKQSPCLQLAYTDSISFDLLEQNFGTLKTMELFLANLGEFLLKDGK